MLSNGYSRAEIVSELNVPSDTFRKAINDGRLEEPEQAIPTPCSTKSERNILDCEAASKIGTACTRVEERTAAAFGMSDGAKPLFLPSIDVPKAGALCALPSLLASGLLKGTRSLLNDLQGYYRTAPIVILLAYMYL